MELVGLGPGTRLGLWICIGGYNGANWHFGNEGREKEEVGRFWECDGWEGIGSGGFENHGAGM
jgi:hypothetical protein